MGNLIGRHRMTRNRCTALCATLHSETDRGRDRNEGANEQRRGGWRAGEQERYRDKRWYQTEQSV